MTKLSNGCIAVNGGRLVKQNKFPGLSEELEILAPDISGHKSFIVVAYLPVNEAKCRKRVYCVTGNGVISIEFHASKDSLHPYTRSSHTLENIPQRHKTVAKELLQAYQFMLGSYLGR